MFAEQVPESNINYNEWTAEQVAEFIEKAQVPSEIVAVKPNGGKKKKRKT